MAFFQLLCISSWHSRHFWLLVGEGASISEALKPLRDPRSSAVSAIMETENSPKCLVIYPSSNMLLSRSLLHLFWILQILDYSDDLSIRWTLVGHGHVVNASLP